MTKTKINTLWDRVIGTPISKDEQVRRDRNKSTFESKNFIEACQNAKIERTTRQASKWNNKKGIAYKTFHKIINI